MTTKPMKYVKAVERFDWTPVKAGILNHFPEYFEKDEKQVLLHLKELQRFITLKVMYPEHADKLSPSRIVGILWKFFERYHKESYLDLCNGMFEICQRPGQKVTHKKTTTESAYVMQYQTTLSLYEQLFDQQTIPRHIWPQIADPWNPSSSSVHQTPVHRTVVDAIVASLENEQAFYSDSDDDEVNDELTVNISFHSSSASSIGAATTAMFETTGAKSTNSSTAHQRKDAYGRVNVMSSPPLWPVPQKGRIRSTKSTASRTASSTTAPPTSSSTTRTVVSKPNILAEVVEDEEESFAFSLLKSPKKKTISHSLSDPAVNLSFLSDIHSTSGHFFSDTESIGDAEVPPTIGGGGTGPGSAQCGTTTSLEVVDMPPHFLDISTISAIELCADDSCCHMDEIEEVLQTKQLQQQHSSSSSSSSRPTVVASWFGNTTSSSRSNSGIGIKNNHHSLFLEDTDDDEGDNEMEQRQQQRQQQQEQKYLEQQQQQQQESFDAHVERLFSSQPDTHHHHDHSLFGSSSLPTDGSNSGGHGSGDGGGHIGSGPPLTAEQSQQMESIFAASATSGTSVIQQPLDAAKAMFSSQTKRKREVSFSAETISSGSFSDALFTQQSHLRPAAADGGGRLSAFDLTMSPPVTVAIVTASATSSTARQESAAASTNGRKRKRNAAAVDATAGSQYSAAEHKLSGSDSVSEAVAKTAAVPTSSSTAAAVSSTVGTVTMTTATAVPKRGRGRPKKIKEFDVPASVAFVASARPEVFDLTFSSDDEAETVTRTETVLATATAAGAGAEGELATPGGRTVRGRSSTSSSSFKQRHGAATTKKRGRAATSVPVTVTQGSTPIVLSVRDSDGNEVDVEFTNDTLL